MAHLVREENADVESPGCNRDVAAWQCGGDQVVDVQYHEHFPGGYTMKCCREHDSKAKIKLDSGSLARLDNGRGVESRA